MQKHGIPPKKKKKRKKKHLETKTRIFINSKCGNRNEQLNRKTAEKLEEIF